MADQRSSADLASLRQLPLPDLARQLGYGQDPHDRRRWKRPGSILSLNGQRFYNHLAGQGGGDAIDLVKHARHCSFREACQFLETFDRRPSLSSPTPPTLSLPEDCPANWPLVRQRPAADRRLSPRLLQGCRQRRLIRADRRVNAVFLCTDAQRRVTGAEITGTLVRPDGSRFRMMAARSRKSAGSFWLPVSVSPPQTVILTESAIDALSASSLVAKLETPANLLRLRCRRTRRPQRCQAHRQPPPRHPFETSRGQRLERNPERSHDKKPSGSALESLTNRRHFRSVIDHRLTNRVLRLW